MIDPAANPLSFFASEMVRLRNAAGLSQPALAKRLSYSVSQITKIETCQRIPKAALAQKLDEVLPSDGLFCRLLPLVERSSVLPWFRDLFDVEGAATSIRTYETYWIPGLLQTEAYARAVVAAHRPALSDEDAEQALAMKMTRQEIFDQEDGPHLWAIIDESALLRQVGSPETMDGQYQHLLTMHKHPRVVIQAIPNQAGLACASGRPFSLLSFRHQGDIVYVEDIDTARYIRSGDEVARYSLIFDHLRATALADEKSAGLIRSVILNDQDMA
jgi:transcriptional regulator with XRE-family HTH domain